MSRYILRGGVEGRGRLQILARVWQAETFRLLERAGIQSGMECLDVGCGSGDVSFDLAQLVGPAGRVVALDMDEVQIAKAQEEAKARGIANIEFKVADISSCDLTGPYDFAFSRFLLTHLQNPAEIIVKVKGALRPGGIFVAVDTEFRGLFSEPDSPAVRRFVELYTDVLKRRGGDANIGPRLPGMFVQCGFENVQMSVAQHAAMEGSEKVLVPLTMDFISEAVIAEGRASRSDIDHLVAELHQFASSPKTVLSGPRAIEVWGNRPAG